MKRITLLTMSALPIVHWLSKWRHGKLHRQSSPGGPAVVYHNLLAGLNRLNVRFYHDPVLFLMTPWLGIPFSESATNWACEQKKRNVVNYIVAGPNISSVPDEHNGLMRREEIDIVLVPSRWVKDWFIERAPELRTKLRVWPSGVNTDAFHPILERPNRPIDFILYNKIMFSENLGIYNHVVDVLKKENFKFETFEYGKFQHHDFIAALQRSKAMIYLVESETQGMAQFEAWSCDVPILAWDRQRCDYLNYHFEGATSCPYMTPQTGMRFSGIGDFEEQFRAFIEMMSTFSPRQHMLKNHTIIQSAKAYLSFFDAILKKRSQFLDHE